MSYREPRKSTNGKKINSKVSRKQKMQELIKKRLQFETKTLIDVFERNTYG